MRQLGEGCGIQDADGVGGERQEADQDVGAVQEDVQLAAAGIADDAIERLRAAAPAQHLEALGHERARRGGAELAQTHETDPALGGLGREGVGPLARPLRALEAIELPVVAQHGQQHVLGHGAGERRVDHARDRHVRQIRVGDQAVDARGKRQDRPRDSGSAPAPPAAGATLRRRRSRPDRRPAARCARPAPGCAPAARRARASAGSSGLRNNSAMRVSSSGDGGHPAGPGMA